MKYELTSFVFINKKWQYAMRCCKQILFCLLIVICAALNGQAFSQALQGQPLRDSLLKALRQANDDTSKIYILYKLAKVYSSNDSAMSFKYARECLQLSKQINWQKGSGLAYLSMAQINNELTNYTAAIECSENAYIIFSRLQEKKLMGQALIETGVAYELAGFYIKSIQNLLAALQLFEGINEPHDISICYNNIGIDYYFLSEYDKAIDNYRKSLIQYNIEGDQLDIASGLDNIALAYENEGNYDSANVYNLKAIKIFEALNNLHELATIYSIRGSILMDLHDAKSAYEFYNRSLSINKKLGVTDGMGTNYANIGTMYLELAKDSARQYKTTPFPNRSREELLQEAKSYLLQAITFGKKANDIRVLMDHYETLSEVEERLGNYKDALFYHREYALYKDSIFNDENKRKLQAMETERLAQIKDQQIQLLNKQKELETSEVKRQTLMKNMILVSVFAVAILTTIFIYLYNRRKKAKTNKLVMEMEMKALRAQMNPHFIFNSLHSINKFVVENDKDNASSYLSKFAQLMRLILENSREQEVPLEKDLQALELYMQLEALRFKNRFSYSIETDINIDKENTLIPPLLLQPFVENAILHGVQYQDNGFIKVQVKRESEMICCVIEDNGNGSTHTIAVEMNEIKTHKSLGKKIISERLNVINQLKKVKASVNIFDLKDANNKTSGMRVELLLPLELAF